MAKHKVVKGKQLIEAYDALQIALYFAQMVSARTMSLFEYFYSPWRLFYPGSSISDFIIGDIVKTIEQIVNDSEEHALSNIPGLWNTAKLITRQTANLQRIAPLLIGDNVPLRWKVADRIFEWCCDRNSTYRYEDGHRHRTGKQFGKFSHPIFGAFQQPPD